MGTNGIDVALNSGYTVKLQNRGPKNSDITFELKNIFDQMVQKGIIKDKNNDGLTKAEAQNLYAILNNMHQSTNRATNYSTMQVGQEFNYSAAEIKQLAEAAGYEVVTGGAGQVEADTPQQDLVGLDGSGTETDPYQLQELEIPFEGDLPIPTIEGDSPGISIDSIPFSTEIPDGVVVEHNTVDGKKDVLTYVLKDENGQEQRYLMLKNEETGLYQKGEQLVSVAGTNKFVSQSTVDAKVKELLNGAELPEGLELQLIESNGDIIYIFKKDGQRLNDNELKALIENPIIEAQDPIAPVATGPSDDPVYDAAVQGKGIVQNSQLMTDEQLAEYLNNDVNYQNYVQRFNEIDSRMKEIEAMYGITRVDIFDNPDFNASMSRLNIVGKPEEQEYTNWNYIQTI